MVSPPHSPGFSIVEQDLPLPDGRNLHFYLALPEGHDPYALLPVFWHHGSPNVGWPPAPMLDRALTEGLVWVSYDRPGYGGSTRHTGRRVIDGARDVLAIADHLGVDRFAVMGHSGGGPHALAVAATAPERVVAVVVGAGVAPYLSMGEQFFGGMAPWGVASLKAAIAGLEVKEAHEVAAMQPGVPEPSAHDIGFIDADLAALRGDWAWLESVVGPGLEHGPGGLIDDDLAFVNEWGFDPAAITAPVLLFHGGADAMVPSVHSRWLSDRLPIVTLWEEPEAGHISVLSHAHAALSWLGRAARL